MEKKLIPELRFPEFTGEWEENKLNSVVKFYKGKGIPKNALSDKGVPCVLYGQLYTTYKEVISSVNSYTNIEIDKLLFSKYGDILIPSSGETALDMSLASALLLDNIALGGDINILRVDEDKINSIFVSYQINSKRKIDLAKIAEGSSVVHIYNSNLKSIKISTPSLPEQEKIGDFFFKLDEKIDLQRNYVEKLKDKKKGLMQRIFSREVRFKDENGEDYPEWENRKLGDISKNYGGTALEKYVHEDGTHKFISIGNYSIDGQYIDNGQRVLLNDKTKTKLLYKNDIAMILNDKTKTGDIIGSSILIDANNEYVYNQRTQRIVFDETVSNKYIFYLLNDSIFRRKVFKNSQGGTQIYINFTEVEKINTPIPSLPEQEKIANILSKLDEKIELEKSLLEKYEDMKKGLMQRMFI